MAGMDVKDPADNVSIGSSNAETELELLRAQVRHLQGQNNVMAMTTTTLTQLKEAEGRAGTVRFNQRSSNALYCRVNERMNNEVRRDSCSSSLINFVLNLSKLFLMNCRMSSS